MTADQTLAALAAWGKKTRWQGLAAYKGTFEDREAIILAPAKPLGTGAWGWRSEFFGAFAYVDKALVRKGYYVAFLDIPNLYGSPTAVAYWDRFYKFVTKQFGFAAKPALIGLSRGGLLVYNWAAKNPAKVGCIYADAPVCDIKSWPGGFGVGPGSPDDWQRCLKAYKFTQEQALKYRKNPIDTLKVLAKNKIPCLHVCGLIDEVVPYSENTAILVQRYRALGGSIQEIKKPRTKHHPHSLKKPDPIVRFIQKHCP